MTEINKIEVALFISFGLLLVYLIYSSLLRYWQRDKLMDQVIMTNLASPYSISGKQQFDFELSIQSDVHFSILEEDETHLATLMDKECEIGTHSVNFDCSNLKTGWYWYKLKTPKQTIARKFKVI